MPVGAGGEIACYVPYRLKAYIAKPSPETAVARVAVPNAILTLPECVSASVVANHVREE